MIILLFRTCYLKKRKKVASILHLGGIYHTAESTEYPPPPPENLGSHQESPWGHMQKVSWAPPTTHF
jgi:hypothetical protein